MVQQKVSVNAFSAKEADLNVNDVTQTLFSTIEKLVCWVSIWKNALLLKPVWVDIKKDGQRVSSVTVRRLWQISLSKSWSILGLRGRRDLCDVCHSVGVWQEVAQRTRVSVLFRPGHVHLWKRLPVDWSDKMDPAAIYFEWNWQFLPSVLATVNSIKNLLKHLSRKAFFEKITWCLSE